MPTYIIVIKFAKVGSEVSHLDYCSFPLQSGKSFLFIFAHFVFQHFYSQKKPWINHSIYNYLERKLHTAKLCQFSFQYNVIWAVIGLISHRGGIEKRNRPWLSDRHSLNWIPGENDLG